MDSQVVKLAEETLGRYDALIVRGEHELRVRGPRFHLHAELWLAYNAIREHARRAGLPVDRISEIALEINPAMFS